MKENPTTTFNESVCENSACKDLQNQSKEEILTNIPLESDESSPTNFADEEMREKDRTTVRSATISSWLKRVEDGEDASRAPEWVQKEIRSRFKKEDVELDELSEFKDALSETCKMSGLKEDEFYKKYGDNLQEEVETLVDYGLPTKLALKKAISIIGVRSEGDRQREERKNFGMLPPRSNVLPKVNDFYLIPTKEFDSFNESKKKRYMKECEERFGEVVFI